MKLVIEMALRDLARNWMQLVCNVAIIIGIVVPLLVLFGVKNGVYDLLEARLLKNPAALRIDTIGNNTFSAEDAELIKTWNGAGFVTLRTRSLFDFVNVRAVESRQKREALLEPTGPGDPSLPEGTTISVDQVVVSETLASQLTLSPGAPVQIVTQAPERPRQLLVEATVAAVLPADRLDGRVVLADIALLDLVEAFYDEYALPDYGITAGKPLDERIAAFEGLRVYANSLEEVGPLQTRIEAMFDVRTDAKSREIAATIGLGRNLNLALSLTATIAAAGLAATLFFGFWGDVIRRRRTLATLSLLGIAPDRMAIFPLAQALTTASLALILSFALVPLGAWAAESLFANGLADGERLFRLGLGEGVLIALAVLILVAATALYAAYEAGRIDPAIVLRDGE